MGTRIPVSDKLRSPGVQILLGIPQRFFEGGRGGIVQYANPRARAFVDLDAVETGIVIYICSALADSPDLAGLKRIVANFVICSKLRCRDELLDSIITQEIAEVGIPELGSADTFLLFLYSTPNLQRKARGPLKILVRHRHFLTGIHQLEQARHCFIDSIGIATTQSATQVDTVLHGRNSALEAQSTHALGEEVTHQTEMICCQCDIHFWHVPAG